VLFVFFFQAEDGIRDRNVTGVQTCALPIFERYSHVLLGAAFARPELQDVIKWHSKYARQNGIHVSPTFMVNGLVQPDLGSGDDEIGRASCRESVWGSAGGGARRKKDGRERE